MKDDEVVTTLSSEEYNHYILKPGEEFDYREFVDIDIMMKSDLLPYFRTMEREYNKGVHISILTARRNKRMIHDFFLKKTNIDIHPKLIFATGDDTSDTTIAEKKAKCIRTLVDYGYRTLIFFDDNVDNLKEVKSMGNLLNIKIHTVKA